MIRLASILVLILAGSCFAQPVPDATGKVVCTTADEFLVAVADPAVREIDLGGREFVLTTPTAPRLHRFKVFLDRPNVTIQNGRLIVDDHTNHWPGLWIGANPHDTRGEVRLDIRGQTLRRGSSVVRVSGAGPRPKAGDDVLIYLGVHPTDAAEPFARRWFRVQAVSGDTLTLHPDIDLDIPTFKEGTDDWVLPSQDYRRKKVAPYGEKSGTGQLGRGWGRDHTLYWYPNGATKNITLRDLEIVCRGPDGAPTTHPPLVLRRCKDIRIEDCTIRRAGYGNVMLWSCQGVRLRNVNGLEMRNDRLNGGQHAATAIVGWGCHDCLWDGGRIEGQNIQLFVGEAGASFTARNWRVRTRYSDPGHPTSVLGVAGGSTFNLVDSSVEIRGGKWQPAGGADLQGHFSRIEQTVCRLHGCEFTVPDMAGLIWWRPQPWVGPLTLNGQFSLGVKEETKEHTLTLKDAGPRGGYAPVPLPAGLLYSIKVETVAGQVDRVTRADWGANPESYCVWLGGMARHGQAVPGLIVWGTAGETVKVRVSVAYRPEIQ